MKITTIVRTRNEEKNIRRFIQCYLNAGVDEIIVSDGGSEDNTVLIAETYKKVTVLHYDVKVPMDNGLWRNPNGDHWNFLIDHAISNGADWILHDDADCVPNRNLQNHLREGLEEATKKNLKVAMAYRLYMWGKYEYFPELNKHGQGLYAFTKDSGIRFVEGHPYKTELVDNEPLRRTYKFLEPEVLLHYFCSDPETVERKMKFYINSGEIPGYVHPLESCGKLSPIEPWMNP